MRKISLGIFFIVIFDQYTFTQERKINIFLKIVTMAYLDLPAVYLSKSLVSVFWSQSLGLSLLVPISWSQSLGLTLLVSISWSHSLGLNLLVSVSYSQSLSLSLLVSGS